MDFRFTPEQEMLRDSVSAALDGAPVAETGRTLGALGVFGIFLPEADGGSGLGASEAALVSLEAERRNLPFPVSETMAAIPLLAKARPGELAGALLGQLWLTAPAQGTLARSGQLHGIVPFADLAAYVAVPLEPGQMVLVPMARLSPEPRAELDLAVPNARVRFDVIARDAPVTRDDYFAARLQLLRAAEMIGAARNCFDLAVQYLNDRTQFGRPIGANQALKHIAAENFVRLEGMRVALEYACAAHDLARSRPDDAEAVGEAAQALEVLLAASCGKARQVAEDAIQLHGGIGVTWDYPLNAHLRRIMRLGASLGTGEAHAARLADRLLGETPASAKLNAAAE